MLEGRGRVYLWVSVLRSVSLWRDNADVCVHLCVCVWGAMKYVFIYECISNRSLLLCQASDNPLSKAEEWQPKCGCTPKGQE